MQSYLRMLKNNSTEESSAYKKLVSSLYEITLAGLLLKYARNTACKFRVKTEWWVRVGLFAF
jgi:hypothetical protein